MGKVTDVTDEELSKTSGPGDYVKRVIKAKPAKQLTPTLQATLDAWNRRYDKSIGWISQPLAYGFDSSMRPSQHSNMIRLLKGGHLRLCRIDRPAPKGSNAHGPWGSDRYYVIRESCPDDLPEGTIAGRRKRR